MQVHQIVLRIQHMAAELERLSADLADADKKTKHDVRKAVELFRKQAQHIDVQNKRQFRLNEGRRANPATLHLRNQVVIVPEPHSHLPEAVARIKQDDDKWESYFSKAASYKDPDVKTTGWDSWDDED